ncbi:WecB/TagA/CpsF family glycosyltransferase [Prevotella sp. E9-3]|uniref:WecB/TagA/CpsF family glycosyltransferase n=1 Tax=Prevotella sp. E9-3 TaxID=2913621 RepID=UPI001EDADF57|nr:WecB/TagA/CpsF family glycosyltransferase [Prevotella sp. E9-3]UKK47594.1 WecB/TagA/CpsF family glycosyltransferase [Prevotella sp. E9-3]
MEVFNINIEFDSEVFKNTVEKYIKEKKKAYVCVVDANVITIAQKDLKYREIVKNATINTCDGSSIAKMVNKIYGTHYHAYNGPELFEYYIERPYKHLLLGNKASKVDQIKAKVKEKGIELDMQHLDVPFVPVEQFDYEGIAKQINEIKPDIVWVSLGAPKQETFISNIFPYVNQSVFFGIGAAFNFYTGDLHNNKKEFGGLRLIWLERIFKEPKKQLKRVGGYLMMVPKMYFEEKRKAKQTSKNTK